MLSLIYYVPVLKGCNTGLACLSVCVSHVGSWLISQGAGKPKLVWTFPMAGVADVTVFSSKDQRSGGRPRNMLALGRHISLICQLIVVVLCHAVLLCMLVCMSVVTSLDYK